MLRGSSFPPFYFQPASIMPAPTATQSATKVCANCTHWNQSEASAGECRRHAPQTVVFNVDANVKFESRFPVTKAADWCGDFQIR